MSLENTKYRVMNNLFKKCGFCGKELKPKGMDYLYDNIEDEFIEYEKCDCEKAKKYWGQVYKNDLMVKQKEKYRTLIHEIYKEAYMRNRLKNYNFENFRTTDESKKVLDLAKKFTQDCTQNRQKDGLILIGDSGSGKTHLASAIANKLIENGEIVLMGRLSFLLDKVKDTFKKRDNSERELIELYSNIDMLIIDDLGTEKISEWMLEKLFVIVSERYENNLPIIIATKFNKNGLMKRFEQSKDKELMEATISKLYQMCYAIKLEKQKEKASTSNKTKC